MDAMCATMLDVCHAEGRAGQVELFHVSDREVCGHLYSQPVCHASFLLYLCVSSLRTSHRAT